MRTSEAPHRPHVFVPASQGVVEATTLLLLHGTGADEHDLLPLGRQLLPTANLLSPRGLHLENGMNRFFERYADGSFNEASIDQAVAELVDFVQHSVRHYGLDSTRVVVVGFSNGANTGAALMVQAPEMLSGAVLFGTTRPYRERAISQDLVGKKVWIANGDNDPYANLPTSEAWVAELKAAGAEVTFLRHPGGHQISSLHVQQISRVLT